MLAKLPLASPSLFHTHSYTSYLSTTITGSHMGKQHNNKVGTQTYRGSLAPPGYIKDLKPLGSTRLIVLAR